MPRGRSRARSSSPGGFGSRSNYGSNVPAARPSTSVAAPQTTQRSPGLFGQMASTAAGVAVGSTIGHVVGGALTGGNHDNYDTAPSQQSTNTAQGSNPCQFEFEQFVQCAQNQHDITFCKGFNEVLKQCKIDHGLM